MNCTMQSHLAIASDPDPTKVWQASTINRKITCLGVAGGVGWMPSSI